MDLYTTSNLMSISNLTRIRQLVNVYSLFARAGHFRDQIFHAPRAKFWYYAGYLRTPSVTYPLCVSALADTTTDNFFKMCPLKLTDFCLFCTIDHTQSYKGRLFPQWLSQVVMTGARTCYPQFEESALQPRNQSDLLIFRY